MKAQLCSQNLVATRVYVDESQQVFADFQDPVLGYKISTVRVYTDNTFATEYSISLQDVLSKVSQSTLLSGRHNQLKSCSSQHGYAALLCSEFTALKLLGGGQGCFKGAIQQEQGKNSQTSPDKKQSGHLINNESQKQQSSLNKENQDSITPLSELRKDNQPKKSSNSETPNNGENGDTLDVEHYQELKLPIAQQQDKNQHIGQKLSNVSTLFSQDLQESVDQENQQDLSNIQTLRKKLGKMTLTDLNIQVNMVIEFYLLHFDSKKIIGNALLSSKVQMNLGSETGCLPETALFWIVDNKPVLKVISSCNVGYIIDQQPFQILNRQVLLFYNKNQQQIIYFDNVAPASQIKDQRDLVQSPQLMIEDQTEGLEHQPVSQATLDIYQYQKDADTKPFSIRTDINEQKAFSSTSLIGQIVPSDYQGEFEIRYRIDDHHDKQKFWDIRVIKKDANYKLVLLFRNQDQIKNKKESYPFELFNDTQVLIGRTIFQVNLE